MERARLCIIVGCTVVCLTAGMATAGTLKCPPDSVKVGTTCVDTYEASVWQIDPANKRLVKKVQDGTVTLADLASAKPAPVPGHFPDDAGNWTAVPGSDPPSPGLYAVSVAGAYPGSATWLQADQLCRLSGKRLLTNAEWQAAAAGTPTPTSRTDNGTDCYIFATDPSGDSGPPLEVPTGSRANCKSSWGAYDMVGNVPEWVAEWADFSGPYAVNRGGGSLDGTAAGVLKIDPSNFPWERGDPFVGFRCGR